MDLDVLLYDSGQPLIAPVTPTCILKLIICSKLHYMSLKDIETSNVRIKPHARDQGANSFICLSSHGIIIVEGMDSNTKASQLLHLIKGPRSPISRLSRRLPTLHVRVGTLSAVSFQWPPWLLDNCFIFERSLKSVHKSDQSCNQFLVTSGRSKVRGLSWPYKNLYSAHLVS